MSFYKPLIKPTTESDIHSPKLTLTVLIDTEDLPRVESSGASDHAHPFKANLEVLSVLPAVAAVDVEVLSVLPAAAAVDVEVPADSPTAAAVDMEVLADLAVTDIAEEILEDTTDRWDYLSILIDNRFEWNVSEEEGIALLEESIAPLQQIKIRQNLEGPCSVPPREEPLPTLESEKDKMPRFHYSESAHAGLHEESPRQRCGWIKRLLRTVLGGIRGVIRLIMLLLMTILIALSIYASGLSAAY